MIPLIGLALILSVFGVVLRSGAKTMGWRDTILGFSWSVGLTVVVVAGALLIGSAVG